MCVCARVHVHCGNGKDFRQGAETGAQSMCCSDDFQPQAETETTFASSCPCKTISFYNITRSSTTVPNMPLWRIFIFPLILSSDAQWLIFRFKDLLTKRANQESNRRRERFSSEPTDTQSQTGILINSCYTPWWHNGLGGAILHLHDLHHSILPL